MILSGKKIEEEVRKGAIQIDPFEAKLLNPNSYNYRLGEELLVMPGAIDTKLESPRTQKFIIPEIGYILQPGIVYLGHTFERIGSKDFVPSLIGRSSLGRLGLFLQITADLGHLGTFHRWTLELTVVQPLRIYPKMRIGQISFWEPEDLTGFDGPGYAGEDNSYARFSTSAPSLTEKFFE